MSKYIERKAAIKRIEEIPAYFDSGDIKYGVELALQEIKDVPTADVEEVVRCKDCKHFLDWQSKSHQGICMCKGKETVYGSEFHPFESDFCNYAERKDEE